MLAKTSTNPATFLLKIELQVLVSPSQIKYTTDGTAPTLNSQTYATPIVISSDTIIKAAAVVNGVLSPIVSTGVFRQD